MVRTMDRLTALKVGQATRKPSMYADGSGLYLQVTHGGASWIYRYMLKGVAREIWGSARSRSTASRKRT